MKVKLTALLTDCTNLNQTSMQPPPVAAHQIMVPLKGRTW